MGKTYLLDCTLRDGGYVNNWNFGENTIKKMAEALANTGVDVLELGFLRDEVYDPNRAVWNDINQVSEFLPHRFSKRKIQYAVMGEVFNPYPLEKLPPRNEHTVDIIRVIVWKRMLPEAFEYCKGIVDRGYRLCVQPDRINQYTTEEFQELIYRFSALNPMAIYIVDSNGLLCKKQIMEYLKAADDVMPSQIILGYHGHNNLLQAVGAAESFVELGLERDIMIDASIRGIGRSSGNLHTELFAKYMNDNYGATYDINAMIGVWEDYIEPVYKKKAWGYSMETFITAWQNCNPNYASILKEEYKLTPREIAGVIQLLSDTDRVITNRDKIAEYIELYKESCLKL